MTSARGVNAGHPVQAHAGGSEGGPTTPAIIYGQGLPAPRALTPTDRLRHPKVLVEDVMFRRPGVADRPGLRAVCMEPGCDWSFSHTVKHYVRSRVVAHRAAHREQAAS